MRILICGNRAFAATGLEATLTRLGHEVDCFSRGLLGRLGGHVSGDVFSMSENAQLRTDYNVIINFILIKGGSLKENLDYCASLIAFCNKVKPDALLHISSISAFSRNEERVDETTSIAAPGEQRGPYATLKAEIDHFLAANSDDFKVSFLRPGFVTNGDEPASLAGITRKVTGSLSVLLGDNHTPLPTIDRTQLHQAIGRIVNSTPIAKSYILLANNGSTKATFAQTRVKGIIIPLPKVTVILAAQLLTKLRLMTPVQLVQVQGLFTRTRFDSAGTEKALGMVFT